MVTVVLELRSRSDDMSIKSIILHLSQVEFDELKLLVDKINCQDGVLSVECYAIS